MADKSQNPFLNHLVIENVLQYVGRLPDLRNLRLVNKQWNLLVNQKLMRDSVVNIHSEKTMEHYMNFFPDKQLSHKNFHVKILKSLESETIRGFLNFILCGGAEELHLSKCVMKPKEILKLVQLGQSSLKTLSFNEVLVEDDTDSEFGSYDADDPPKFSSNLRRLEVTTCEECNLFPWGALFPYLPHLEVLHAQMQDYAQVNSLLESLLEYPIKLREFSSFLIDFESSHLALLQSLDWPLISLDLSISSTVETKEIENLLKSSSFKKIQTLKLFHETEVELNEIVLPVLKTLKSLELMGDPVGISILPSIYYGCPNLQHLNLSQLLLEHETKSLSSIKFVHRNLISLSIEEGYLSKDELTKLSQLFPMLRKVYLFLNDENIGAVYKTYNNLEELIVLGTQLSDLGIIGIGKTSRCFIGDCKKLRKFSLYPQPQERITDLSVLHGLIHVPQLLSVELPETCVTNEGLKALIKSKPNICRLSAKIAINPRTGEHSLRSTKYQI